MYQTESRSLKIRKAVSPLNIQHGMTALKVWLDCGNFVEYVNYASTSDVLPKKSSNFFITASYV